MLKWKASDLQTPVFFFRQFDNLSYLLENRRVPGEQKSSTRTAAAAAAAASSMVSAVKLPDESPPQDSSPGEVSLAHLRSSFRCALAFLWLKACNAALLKNRAIPGYWQMDKGNTDSEIKETLGKA